MAKDKVIKIGTLFPLTGPCALAGQRCQASVATAVDVINNKHADIAVPLAAQEGILDGYRVELVHADHQGKPDVGKSEAERLYNQEGVTVLLVEQMVQEALEIAHRGYVLQTGRVVQAGAASELLDSEEVRKAYMGM